MPAERTCPRCGTILSSAALEGLCPTCVGRAAFANASAIPRADTEASDVGEPALSPEIEAEFARLKPEEGGEWIGRYKLLEQIGEGGFGVVWVAEQTEPVRRRVALKIIKMGMDTKDVIARFEQERQALAMMDHPNIAKVLDAGATQWGRPFFVMELVRGIKITEYCDQQELSTAERLALFIRVCNAVQHAHQKGIIHRDLKPSNILVTINDGEAVPKVIDFGVAKATQGRLSEHTVYTQFQQMIGTPLYMSPEQAEMTSLDIDTRSDIYSLGVLLYELLTGRTPIAQETLARVGLDEIRRVIREVDPPRPSMRFKTMDQGELTSAAKRRHMDSSKLTSALRGDLDWIVMKALEKNRNRRYETANGLAMDLQRHLQSEPVSARPPNFGYKAGKFIRKHRGPFVGAVAVVLALIAGLVASTVLYFREKAAWLSESAQKAKAETEAIKSQQVAKFLQDMLKGVGPQVALGQDVKLLHRILDDTAERVSKDLNEQPAVEAELRETMGGVYFDLGEWKRAEEMYREALRLNERAGGSKRGKAAARLLNRLGHTLAELHRPEAEEIFKQALALNKSLSGEVNEGVAMSLYGLGRAAYMRGDLDAAQQDMREALDQWKQLGKEQSPEATLTLNDLGLVLMVLGKPAEAETAFADALAKRTKTFGEINPGIAESLGNRGLAQYQQGRLLDAERTISEALALNTKMLPEAHLDFGSSYNNLALVLRDKGDLAGAETMQRRALEIVKQTFPGAIPVDIPVRTNLAIILRRRGAQSEDLAKLSDALQTNPGDALTADALAALLAKPMLSPILSEQQRSAAPWQYTSTQPDSTWLKTGYSPDTTWKSVPAPHGSPTFFPRKQYIPITSHTDLWLRREFELSALPAGKLLLRINRNHDAQVFLNGKQASPTADWSDTDVLVPCREEARAALTLGHNVLAVHCQDADFDAPIDIGIYATPDPFLGRIQLIEKFHRMIEEEPQEPQRAELHAGRASALARLGRWKDAATDLTTAIELKHSKFAYWYQLAPLLLETGDQAGYLSRRQVALEQFSKPDNPDVAGQVSRLALLFPAQGTDLEAAVKLADISAAAEFSPGLSWRQVAKGLAEYRKGRFDSAIGWMGKALETGAQKDLPAWSHERERNRAATAYLVQAMAHHQLHHSKEAGETLAKAIEIIEKQCPKVDDGDLGREWPDWLFANILRREAESLIGDKSKTAGEIK